MGLLFFFFQAEDGIRYLVRSRGLGDVYKRQQVMSSDEMKQLESELPSGYRVEVGGNLEESERSSCLLYTSDAADERSSVDLGGRRIIKKKK